MSLKQEIETWVKAQQLYDNQEYDAALDTFEKIPDTSKILFNIGVINATLGKHEVAVDCYGKSVKLDQYLAVAYFQEGVSNFLLGDFEEALANFNDTLLYLRGNRNIDYEQLGLKFKLYSCEALFNRGLCYIYLQQIDAGMQDLQYAAAEKVVPDHDVIDEAITEQAEGYTVFSIPVGIIFRPNEAKVKNMKTKDYLGKAKLVAATDQGSLFTGFQGIEQKKINIAEVAPKDDRIQEQRSFAATSLVRTDIVSRRQQSEPPLNRNLFPPTPPPEDDAKGKSAAAGRVAAANDKIAAGAEPPKLQRTLTARASSMKNAKVPPRRLDLGNAAFEQPAKVEEEEEPAPAPAPASRRPARSASERPAPRARNYEGSMSSRRGGNQHHSEEEDAYDDVYDMYTSSAAPSRKASHVTDNFRSPNSNRGSTRPRQPEYISEEEDDRLSGYEMSPGIEDDEVEFDMIPNRVRSKKMSMASAIEPPLRMSASKRPNDIRKIRVKVHVGDDTRYVMIGGTVEWDDFNEQIQQKFKLKKGFKLRMLDEGEMITMGDQDDLELMVSTTKKAAAKEKSEMGKMEIWVEV